MHISSTLNIEVYHSFKTVLAVFQCSTLCRNTICCLRRPLAKGYIPPCIPDKEPKINKLNVKWTKILKNQKPKERNQIRIGLKSKGCGQGYIPWGKSEKPGPTDISFSPKRCESLSRTGPFSPQNLKIIT